MIVRTLTCCVCGIPTRGRQHFNRDAGYGVCPEHGQKAIAKEGEAAALSYYGTRGFHWDVDFKSEIVIARNESNID